jgi:hypothetical protein
MKDELKYNKLKKAFNNLLKEHEDVILLCNPKLNDKSTISEFRNSWKKEAGLK